MKHIILINGKKQSELSIFNRLTQFGDGLFETCVFEKGRLLFWSKHFARLETGRKQLKINAVSEKKWLKNIKKALGIAKLDDAVVKIILSRGESFRGYGFKSNIKPTHIVIVCGLRKSMPNQYGLTTCDSGYSNNQRLSHIKHCNRLEQILARVKMQGDDCIMLNDNADVISTTQSNIFAVRDGELLTPNLDNCGIEGTRRAAVLTVAEELGLKVHIGALPLPDLLKCSEIFITNSVIGIKSVCNINQQLFTIHTITDKIRNAFLKLQNLPMHSPIIKPKRHASKFKLLVLLALLMSVWAFYLVKDVKVNQPVVYQISSGATISKVSYELKNLGYINSATYVLLLAKVLNFDEQLKRGYYQLTPNMSVHNLLQDFVSGSVTTRKTTLVEGQTISDYYQQLSQNNALKSNGDFDKTLKLTNVQPPYEGYFWADTYQIDYGDSVLSVLKRAHRIMQHKLGLAWQNAAKNLPLKNAYQALILASLIEKETAHNAEKPRIAGVFIRRLQLGMRLQTDPTVVYALGDKYRGSLSRQDLKFDSPYNTYKYEGLPPSPIASVSQTSLDAAMHPADGDDLYFVAKKDGTHAFAKTYQQHRLNIKKWLTP